MCCALCCNEASCYHNVTTLYHEANKLCMITCKNFTTVWPTSTRLPCAPYCPSLSFDNDGRHNNDTITSAGRPTARPLKFHNCANELYTYKAVLLLQIIHSQRVSCQFMHVHVVQSLKTIMNYSVLCKITATLKNSKTKVPDWNRKAYGRPRESDGVETRVMC